MTENRIVITQGGQAVSRRPEDVITTLLGSCVSVCLWDPTSGVGGMNHMLLAASAREGTAGQLAEMNAMELLINEMLKQGAVRTRCVAKVFGGAAMVEGLSDIGAQNGAYALEFLEREGIEVTGQSLGGTRSRNLMFWPATGKVRQKLGTAERLVLDPTPVRQPEAGNGMELL